MKLKNVLAIALLGVLTLGAGIGLTTATSAIEGPNPALAATTGYPNDAVITEMTSTGLSGYTTSKGLEKYCEGYGWKKDGTTFTITKNNISELAGGNKTGTLLVGTNCGQNAGKSESTMNVSLINSSGTKVGTAKTLSPIPKGVSNISKAAYISTTLDLVTGATGFQIDGTVHANGVIFADVGYKANITGGSESGGGSDTGGETTPDQGNLKTATFTPIDFFEGVGKGDQKPGPFTVGPISFLGRDNGNNSKVYDNGTSWRHYASNDGTVTISAISGALIKEVTFSLSGGGFTCTAATGSNPFSFAEGVSSAVFTATGTAKITGIDVKYSQTGEIVIPDTVNSITISTPENTKAIYAGQSYQMSAVVDTTYQDKTVTWSLANLTEEDTATISPTGLLNANKPGNVDVIATSNADSTKSQTLSLGIRGSSTVLPGQTYYDFAFNAEDKITPAGTTWSSSYAKHDEIYDRVKVSFDAGAKSNTIKDIPAVKDKNLTFTPIVGKGAIDTITLNLRRWSETKTPEINVYLGSETTPKQTYKYPGSSYAITFTTGSNVEMPVTFGFAASGEHIGIDSAVISYHEPVVIETLETIEITNLPAKTTYYEGETIDYTGLTIIGHAGGQTKPIALDDPKLELSVAVGTVFGKQDVGENLTLTVTYHETNKDLTATFNYTVLANTAILYNKVTSVDQLKLGTEIIILGVDPDTNAIAALSTIQNSNNRDAVSVDSNHVANDVLSVYENDAFAKFRLGQGLTKGTYTLQDEIGYIYAAGTEKSGNYLRSLNIASKTQTHASIEDKHSWVISFDTTGELSVKANGTAKSRDLRYNVSGGIFSCYGGTQEVIQFYAKAPTAEQEVLALADYINRETYNNQCTSKFALANDIYCNKLSAEAQNIFNGTTASENIEINSARERYTAWAKSLHIDDIYAAYTPATTNLFAETNDTNTIIVIVATAILSISTIAFFVISKRRRLLNK